MNDLILLATVCFVAMVSPGPDFILVTKNSLIYPKRQALATALGIVSGCFIHASYCILGLALIITKSVLLFSFIKYTGACYLIYLGWKGLTSKPDHTYTNIRTPARIRTTWGAFVEGFLCNVLNPKLAVFLLSLFTQFISVDASLGQKAIVAAMFIGESALYWPLVVFLLQSKSIQNLFQEWRVTLDRICGAMLIGLGIRVAVAKN